MFQVPGINGINYLSQVELFQLSTPGALEDTVQRPSQTPHGGWLDGRGDGERHPG